MFLLKVLVEHNVFALNSYFYYCSLKEVQKGIRVQINFNNKELYGFVVETKFIDCDDIKKVSDEVGLNLKFIDRQIDETPIINEELFKLANILSKRYFYPLIGTLQTILPKSLRPKKLSNVSHIQYEYFYKLHNEQINKFKINNFEKRTLNKFSQIDFIPKSNISQSKSLISLMDKGIITLEKKEKYRLDIEPIFDYKKQFSLSKEQSKVFEEYKNSNYIVYLLHGVTGSGKTEIYIKAVEEAINDGKNALILVPEIALTPLMISRILAYFSVDIAVLHSSLTEGQRYDEYRKIKNNHARIVIGTRSAIFAPLSNIGVIIIDEEHSDTYKENETLCYDARDVAMIRATYYKCKVILGSATPSIETMSKARNDVYKLLTLNERFNHAELPEIITIDRTKFTNFPSISQAFSYQLIKEIKLRLLKNERTIIFINTKGYGRSFYCRECGHTFKCPHCDMNLIYYKEDETLRCNHCGYKIRKLATCPNCGSKYLSYLDFGIEKVEEDFKKIFKVPYLVLDGDRTPKSSQISTILSKFNKKEALVLIGTQIVSKGHDFDDVTLVAIVNADSLLSIATYKASENAFDLITQTIGRAGRADKKGLAIIQTSFKDDNTIKFAINNDYMSFYKSELERRKLLNNPPFYKIILIEIIASDANLTYEVAKDIKNYIELSNENLIMLNPSEPFWYRKQYKTNLYLKCKKISDVKASLNEIIDIYKSKNNILAKINVNPIDY